MAICYNCGQQFYGNECDFCGWVANYKCWNCGIGMTPIEGDNHKCSFCGWFVCNGCGQCGCNESRPMSNEEKRREKW